jgi:Transglutaminase-like superfamily
LRLLRRCRALRELRGAREAALFVRVSAFAACVPLLLRLPLPRVAALMRLPATRLCSAGRRPAAPQVDYRAERLPDLVRLAQQAFGPVVRTGCLTRGLTLLWFLRRAGLDVELCFGVDLLTGEPDGHCWLERDGEPLFEAVDPRGRFAETYRLAGPVGDPAGADRVTGWPRRTW